MKRFKHAISRLLHLSSYKFHIFLGRIGVMDGNYCIKHHCKEFHGCSPSTFLVWCDKVNHKNVIESIISRGNHNA